MPGSLPILGSVLATELSEITVTPVLASGAKLVRNVLRGPCPVWESGTERAQDSQRLRGEPAHSPHMKAPRGALKEPLWVISAAERM